jgi:TPP-dependent indolepyruvate ferredoxin oxidoreductase alpha subunit
MRQLFDIDEASVIFLNRECTLDNLMGGVVFTSFSVIESVRTFVDKDECSGCGGAVRTVVAMGVGDD